MKYKGYWAEVKYNEKDACFWGSVDGLKKTKNISINELIKEAVAAYVL